MLPASVQRCYCHVGRTKLLLQNEAVAPDDTAKGGVIKCFNKAFRQDDHPKGSSDWRPIFDSEDFVLDEIRP